jgi:fucose 4-O-acetylase-like acetyltransferase
MKDRQIIPDWLKGLAIVFMVYGHTIHQGSFLLYQKQAVGIISTFHMPIFLIISGFFFNTESEPNEIARKVLSRIAKPYLIFISLHNIGLIMIQKVGLSVTNIPPSSFTGFLDIVFLHPNTPHWFLHTIICIQLCLAFAKMIERRANLRYSERIIIFIFLLAILWIYNLIAVASVVYLLTGMTFRLVSKDLPSSLLIGSFFIFVTLLLARDTLLLMPLSFANISFVKFSWALSIFMFLSGVGTLIQKNFIVSIFSWFGRNSLVVLCVHPIFTVLLKPLSTLFLRVEQTGLAYSLFILITVMFGCMLSAFCVDRIGLSIYCFGTPSIYSSFKQFSR